MGFQQIKIGNVVLVQNLDIVASVVVVALHYITLELSRVA